jgi:hypothetical protein
MYRQFSTQHHGRRFIKKNSAQGVFEALARVAIPRAKSILSRWNGYSWKAFPYLMRAAKVGVNSHNPIHRSWIL